MIFGISDHRSGRGGAAANQSPQWGQALTINQVVGRPWAVQGEGLPEEEDPEGGFETGEAATELLEVWDAAWLRGAGLAAAALNPQPDLA